MSVQWWQFVTQGLQPWGVPSLCAGHTRVWPRPLLWWIHSHLEFHWCCGLGLGLVRARSPVCASGWRCGWRTSWCRQDNSPVCELPTDTGFTARACHQFYLECNEFNTQNQGLYYDKERIISWNFRSASNIVIHILENPVNLYDSNGVITFLLWGMRNRVCHFSVYLLFPWNPLNVLGHIIRRSKRSFQGEHNAIGTVRNGSELMEKFQEEVLWI